MRHGFGTHFAGIIESEPSAVPSILIITYVGELTWVYGIGIIRSSALLFYNRIFGVQNVTFQRLVLGGVISNVLFSGILGFVCIFQCMPVAGYWDKTLDPTCMTTFNVELGSGITSIALDLYTLLLPMPYIWRLQMPMSKKLLTMFAFILGYW